MTNDQWQQVEQVFDAVLEQPTAERAAWLQQHYGADEELCREVASLLEHEVADTFLAAPIQEVAQALADKPLDELIGQSLGAYRITHLIGHGGMGAVYQAARADGQFEQQVAIKIIKRGMDSEFVRSRFVQERRILARLEHPNIARLLDGGTTPQGQPYFVMEYVEGRTIHNYCVAQQLSLRDRLQLFRRVCSAVQYAHQNLIVHRDLKPSNILVAADGTPKLLDFGIAKLLTPDTEDTVTQTETAMRLMTPDYASPEQVRGHAITTATDIYSLGAVLYELLTDVRPHKFTSPTPLEIERAICETEILKPSDVVRQMSTAKLARQLTGEVDNIVLMAMRKEPERRYASVEQFSDDIQRYLDERPVIARPDTFTYRTSKFVRRNKLAFAAATLILLSLVGGIVATAREASIAKAATARAETERARAERNLAEAQTQRTEAETQRAEAVRQRGLAEAETLEAEAQRAEAEAQRGEAVHQRAVAEAQTAEALRQRAEAEVQRAIAERRFDQVRKLATTFVFDFHEQIKTLAGSTKAREMLAKTAVEYLDLLAQDAEGNRALQVDLVGAYFQLGTIQGDPLSQNLGQPVEAMASFRKSTALLEKVLAQGPQEPLLLRRLASNHFYLGLLERRRTNFTEAKQHYELVLKITENLMATGYKESELYWLLINGSYQLGSVNESLNDESGTVPLHQKIVAINEHWLAEFPSERARSSMGFSYSRLGQALLGRGDLAEAVTVLNRALAIGVELQRAAPNSATYRAMQAEVQHRLGDVLGNPGNPNLGRAAEAVAHYRQAVAIEGELAAADPKNVNARTMQKIFTNDLALALLESAPQEAATLYRKMLNPDNNPANGPGTATSGFQLGAYVSLAHALWRTGDRVGANQMLADVASALPKQIAHNSPGLQLAWGQLLLEMSDPAHALSQFQLALPQFKEQFAQNPNGLLPRRQLLDIYEALAQGYAAHARLSNTPPEQKLADWQAARASYQQSLDLLKDWPRWADSTIYNSRRAAVTQALAQCDTAIAQLGRR